jgi:uncharacterized protein (DUF302 family)
VASDIGIITFSTPEPFVDALHSIRSALKARGLRIVAELDLSQRVDQTLGIQLPPCRTLLIWPGPLLAMEVPAEAAVLLPLHLVVAGRGLYCDFSLQNRVPHVPGLAKNIFAAAIASTHSEILQSLEAIAMRPSLV